MQGGPDRQKEFAAVGGSKKVRAEANGGQKNPMGEGGQQTRRVFGEQTSSTIGNKEGTHGETRRERDLLRKNRNTGTGWCPKRKGWRYGKKKKRDRAEAKGARGIEKNQPVGEKSEAKGVKGGNRRSLRLLLLTKKKNGRERNAGHLQNQLGNSERPRNLATERKNRKENSITKKGLTPEEKVLPGKKKELSQE